MSEATVPIDTKCCFSCRCGGGCRFAQAAVNRANAHDALVAALERIVTGLEADDHYCCHHARLGRDDHTEDCYVEVARAALEEAKP
ncbi:hypothetical protein LCGC14_1278290 [marine sediment metagenome]|uniref:Uncharacterized protein n=1 Tax=marine sediment metagenome TaxID=412755 RepID=A0A0F9LH86_9ZZZZ